MSTWRASGRRVGAVHARSPSAILKRSGSLKRSCHAAAERRQESVKKGSVFSASSSAAVGHAGRTWIVSERRVLEP